MELWIRSQDKRRLLNVKGFILEESTPWGNKSGILSDSKFLLGLYETKERANEVLDEIQKLIEGSTITYYGTPNGGGLDCFDFEALKENPIVLCKGDAKFDIVNKDVIIYEMPEE